LEELLAEIAADFHDSSDVISVEVWYQQGLSKKGYLAQLITGEHKIVPGSVPWDYQPDLPSLWEKMTQIYHTYKEQHS
jgi:hypothetical protein